jgi:hypothetical protein
VNEVDATTIVYPATQSTSSLTVKEMSFGEIVAEIVVHVGILGFPYIENLQLRQAIPLFPNIGCCFP